MIYIAIGANLPNQQGPDGQCVGPLQTCRWATRRLAALKGLKLAGLSRWYDSAPIPISSQPRFVNGVAALDGAPEPEWLLRELQRIESEAGRLRGARNAARVLDLDIIDINGLVRGTPDPILPHPSAEGRAFVLHPLQDVAPAWEHPGLGISITELIAALPPQDIRMLSEPDQIA
jgi:2-amino-4-hydroxy-6-hydroxymethyldihydropteridine diphosphokinase